MKNFDSAFFKKKTGILLVALMGLLSTNIAAQQHLNLDFEKLSIEGISRPWGWDFVTSTKTNVYLDSTIKHHGKYSLKMEAAENTGKQVISYSFEPYELKNKTIGIDGWVKTGELKGKAGFVVKIATSEDTSEIELKSEEATNSENWIKLTVKEHIPDNITSIALLLQHEGTGTAWFDNFTLTVNDENKKQLEIAPAFTEKQIKWIGDHSYPIKSVNPLQLRNEDLSAFKSLAGDASIIALGESTHGTSEFFKLKHRILEYYVKEFGVRIFAIEDHQLVVTRVNNYVLGGEGTARSSMYGMLGVWQTTEVRDLIEWIRTYNDRHPEDKVEFVGFDIQNYSLAIDSLYSFITKQAPNLKEPITKLLNNLRTNGANSYAVSDSIKLSWYTNSQEVLDLISEHSKNWLSTAKNRKDSLSIYWGLQYANLVKQFAENTYRGHESLYRDIAMAENVSWIHNVYKPGGKMVIWAHDVHISRGEHTDNDMNIYFGKSMGAHLAKKFGIDYRSFGLFTYQGEYSCYISYTNFTVTDCPLYKSPRGSLDHALHKTALRMQTPILFLDLSKARDTEWLTEPIPIRFANHVNIEYGYWTRYSIPYQFDGIFFIDKTTSAKSYARK